MSICKDKQKKKQDNLLKGNEAKKKKKTGDTNSNTGTKNEGSKGGTSNSKNDHSALRPFPFLENIKKEEMKTGVGRRRAKERKIATAIYAKIL